MLLSIGCALSGGVCMGTELYQKHGITVTRFWGGNDRGVCYQITVGTRFVVLSKDEYAEMLVKLVGGEVTR